MQKMLRPSIQLLAAGMMLLGYAPAQQTPAATTPSTPAPAKTAQTPAAKKPTTAAKPAPLTLKTDKDKASYAVGMSIGSGLKRQNVPVDPALVVRGLRDALTGAKPQLTEDEMKAVLTKLQAQVREATQAKAHEASEGNRKEGETFLAANKSKDGVVALPSGLQYKILTPGTGPKPTATDTVKCNYKGTLINGKEFDSSFKRGEPATFPVGGVIKGWTEALQLMPVGSKWQLFIPADLAYGDRGAPPDIGPGDTLIFEVELLSIEEQKK
jgi:FKBP-type peptidyl-prolyl cis-trans isomerase FklB